MNLYSKFTGKQMDLNWIIGEWKTNFMIYISVSFDPTSKTDLILKAEVLLILSALSDAGQ